MNKHFAIVLSGAFGLALACVLLGPSTASAAGYIKISGVEGESTDKGHTGEIDIQSWSWGDSQREAASGMATDKRQHKPLMITKRVDKSSPMLQQASAAGSSIPSMTVYLPKQGDTSTGYLTYELKNVMVTSYQTSRGSSGTVPTETFSLNYEKIIRPLAVEDK
ncbi:MAG TPA: type VI secretion system tube protein Hcp [Xanthomonadales bacterium]|nr:type VI secretion system tube protein Hcp [Xanthomonadales bacterium]